ncbi:MAG: pantetheine-phosphate adenylyltransferase [Lachnospiraceae bacterium]|nr:pantetheine-phosphate adenylyltransferase [Lachnospiraceae bacterium]
MKSAIYPGSFDPVTLGHMDMIERAAGLFDTLYIGILINRKKTPMFSLEKRIEILKEATAHISNVKIISFEGLLADYCRQNKIDAVIRGVRGAMDFDYELPMAQINQKLNPGTQTVFLAARPELSYVSSSAVKELASFGGSYKDMLPEAAYRAMQIKYDETKVEGK